jgi:hypothetical protein
MSGRSKLGVLLDALSTPNDCPRIPMDDELLAALRKEHGEDGRPDLVIPRTATGTLR